MPTYWDDFVNNYPIKPHETLNEYLARFYDYLDQKGKIKK